MGLTARAKHKCVTRVIGVELDCDNAKYMRGFLCKNQLLVSLLQEIYALWIIIVQNKICLYK